MRAKATFFTDLDNTVLYSHRHMISTPVVWVESLNGHNQSFISESTYNYFENQRWMKIVPVTTRTFTQYCRLQDCFLKLGWDEALICNGAVRIVNGMEDSEWRNESVHLSESSRSSFQKAYNRAVELFGVSSVILIEPFMFYIKDLEVDYVYNELFTCTNQDCLSIYKDSRKVYCIHQILNKGTAVSRYKVRFGIDMCLAAGDSEFDISMLRQADISFCPESLQPFYTNGRKISSERLFSDGLCDALEKYRKEELGCDYRY